VNIVYLTWGETPRSYGIFGSQVLNQFTAIKDEIEKSSDLTFIAAVPIIHSGLFREGVSYVQELNKVKSKLKNIEFLWIPIITTQNFVNPSRLTFGLMHIGCYKNLAKKLINKNPDILHCRSYHAAYAAIKIRSQYSLNYKIVFDTRGPWPEAVAFKRGYKDESRDYIYLKKLEKWLLDNSNIIVSVSDTMTAQYKKITQTPIETIYLSAPVDKINQANHIIRSNNTKEEISLVYLGALSNKDWHTPQNLEKVYSKLFAEFTSTKLLIITTSNHDPIKRILSKYLQHITITSTKTPEELAIALSKANIACLPGISPSNNIEKTLFESILGTKTVEYLSAGLPVICNKECAGAAMLIEKHNLGLVYNPINLSEITKESVTTLINNSLSQRAYDTSSKLFDYKLNAHRYINLYKSLLNT